MSRKTISKKFSLVPQRQPKFTRQTKRLFKKFTNGKSFFDRNTAIFDICKHNLPILRLKNTIVGCFCACFCLFWRNKKRIFWNGKFYLPILKDSKKYVQKDFFIFFCKFCTILGAYFLHIRWWQVNLKSILFVADFQSSFPKIKYCDKKQQKSAQKGAPLPVLFTSKIRWRCALRPPPR